MGFVRSQCDQEMITLYQHFTCCLLGDLETGMSNGRMIGGKQAIRFLLDFSQSELR